MEIEISVNNRKYRGKNTKLVQTPKANDKGEMAKEVIEEWTPPTKSKKGRCRHSWTKDVADNLE